MHRDAIRTALLTWAVAGGLAAQTAAPATVDPGATGFRMETESTASRNVSVEAVLLPPNTTRGLFGRAVAARYAAIELTISNHSHDSALVLQSVFIDYSRWLLSGSSGDKAIQDCDQVPAGNRAATTLPECGNRLEPFEAQSKPNQIASAEYRVPRGQLLDAQPTTARNLVIRSLEAAGTVAAGYVFAFKEIGIAKGIASYNGNFLPAARYLWPDSSIDQLNRISDLGFRINTVVPKDSSSIVVAFFPLDRFLTPGLKRLFLKSPALFFVPHAAILDPAVRKMMEPVFKELGVGDARAELVSALRDGKPNDAVRVLNGLSLNRVRVVVGGVMTVEADAVPASIERAAFEDGAALWSEPGVKKGALTGRYMGGGTIAIADADKLGIADIAIVQEGTSDRTLRFQFKLTKAIAPGQRLTFRVNKKDRSGNAVEGIPFDYAANYLLPAPIVSGSPASVMAGETITVKGAGFLSQPERPLAVVIGEQMVTGDALTIKSPNELSFKVPALAPGVYMLKVRSAAGESVGVTITVSAPAASNLSVGPEEAKPATTAIAKRIRRSARRAK